MRTLSIPLVLVACTGGAPTRDTASALPTDTDAEVADSPASDSVADSGVASDTDAPPPVDTDAVSDTATEVDTEPR